MQKYFYDKQEFHSYGNPTSVLPQVSNYRDITFRLNAGIDSLSNTSRECSINPAEWHKRQTAVVSPAPLFTNVQFTNVCRASGCQNMVWGSNMPPCSHTAPPPAAWDENYAKLNSDCTLPTCSCHMWRAAVMLTWALSLTFIHPLFNTRALFQNPASRIIVYFILAS